MAERREVRLPDIGDFKGVDVIEVLVTPGQRVAREESLITLESEKATMEVPSPCAGVVAEIKVKVGDKVSEGDLIVTLDAEQAAQPAGAPRAAAPAPQTAPPPPPVQEQRAAPRPASDIEAEVLVLGAGPGGYTAAFRAADLGKRVVLVERYATLGGVCLNVGCIPSKALLHVAEVIEQAAAARDWGVRFGPPEIDAEGLRAWKNGVVRQLTNGLAQLARQRKVQVVQGYGTFTGPHQLAVRDAGGGTTTVSFEHAIIAAGSRAVRLPGLPQDDARILDSTAALELPALDGRLLVIGGGIIGLEMATVYHAIGAEVTVVELSDSLLPGVDPDLVRPLQKRIAAQYKAVHLGTRVAGVEPAEESLRVRFEGGAAPAPAEYDRVLVAVGRRANGDRIGAEHAGVHVDERGRIPVDGQQRTNVAHIFAIGDIVGDPMLAHKASYEAKVAAEVIAGMKHAFDARVIPSVAYTDPEIAWAGVTETEARRDGLNYGKGVFPWAASGRALAMGRGEGLTKLLFNKDTGRIIGLGIVGPRAGELIAEGALAIEMGADAEDIALTIHPHPTLSETLTMAAETYEGTVTDLYIPKR